MIKKSYNKLTVTFDNVSESQALALKQMFEHMEYLGKLGASRWCSFFSDGDGSFRPEVAVQYEGTLPETKVNGVDRETLDFKIDSDAIAWDIYH